MNILLVAYYYPPIISGGSERPRQMAKYLPRFGHKTSVLTSTYGRSDFSQPGVVRIHDISCNRERTGLKAVKWLGLRLSTLAINHLGMYRTIYSSWKREVLKNTERIFRQCRPQLVIASYPPVEDLEIGLHFSRSFHLPLLADFRDGMIFEPVESTMLKRFACYRRHFQLVEEEVVKHAAAILTCSPRISDYFSRTYSPRMVYTLPNGFDEDDFADLPVSCWELPPGRFHIVHTGGFALSDPTCDISGFVKALGKFVEVHREAASKLQVHLAGRLNPHEIKLLKRFIRSGTVKLYGVLNRKAALALQRKADLLLLIVSSRRNSVSTSKVYEYLRAEKPILALAPRTSFAAEIVDQTGHGWVADISDMEAIYRLMQDIFTDEKFYRQVRPEKEKASPYERRRQMQALSQLIDNLFPMEKTNNIPSGQELY